MRPAKALLSPRMHALLKSITQKEGRLPVIYFSSNTYSLNYYFISQLLYLSKIYALHKVNITIIINDMTGKDPTHYFETASKTRTRNSDVFKILNFFGVPQEHVRVHQLSEAWHNYLATNELSHFEFLHNLIFLKKELSQIPPEALALDFLEKNARYEIYYILQKYTDFLVSAHYASIFPSDFGCGVDVQMASRYNQPLLERIHKDLSSRPALYLQLPEILPFPPLPFFGKSFHIYPEHIVPNIYRSTSDILRAIVTYNLGHHEIDLLYKNFIQYILPNATNTDATLPLSRRRVLLAEDIHSVLSAIKDIISASPKDLLVIEKNRTNASELFRVFNSSLTFKILALCNGEYTITQIAERLGKHQPNISKIVSQLKKLEIVEADKNNHLTKVVNQVHIEL